MLPLIRNQRSADDKDQVRARIITRRSFKEMGLTSTSSHLNCWSSSWRAAPTPKTKKQVSSMVIPYLFGPSDAASGDFKHCSNYMGRRLRWDRKKTRQACFREGTPFLYLGTLALASPQSAQISKAFRSPSRRALKLGTWMSPWPSLRLGAVCGRPWVRPHRRPSPGLASPTPSQLCPRVVRPFPAKDASNRAGSSSFEVFLRQCRRTPAAVAKVRLRPFRHQVLAPFGAADGSALATGVVLEQVVQVLRPRHAACGSTVVPDTGSGSSHSIPPVQASIQ